MKGCNRVFLKAKHSTGAFSTQNPWESGGGGSGQNGGKENETVCVFVKGIFPPKPSPTLTSDNVLNLVPDVKTPQIIDRPIGEFALLGK